MFATFHDSLHKRPLKFPKNPKTLQKKSSDVIPRSLPPIPKLDISSSLEIIPPIGHILAHIKLIRCFVTLKLKFKQNPDKWQIFVKHAFRRFIWFVSLLKNKVKPKAKYTNEQAQLSNYYLSQNAKICTQFLQSQLPPIDILYVWYVLLLSTTNFYEMGIRNSFLEFSFFPFPLLKVANSIDYQFNYRPSTEMIENFVANKKISWNQPSDKILVPVICPICYSQLGTTNLSQLEHINQMVSCKCKFKGQLTLTQLRKRLIFSHLISNQPLPILHSTASVHLFDDGISVEELNEMIKETLTKQDYFLKLKNADISIEDFFNESDLNYNYKKIFTEYYSNLSCISSTVPLTQPFQVNDPFFLERDQFMEKIAPSSLDYEDKLTKACEEYSKFFTVVSECFRNYSLVPLLKIDIVWQTHKLSPYRYIEFSKLRCHGNVIDTCRFSKQGFENTCQLYKTMKHCDYSDCKCNYCFNAGKFIKRSRYSVISESALEVPICSTISTSGTSVIQNINIIYLYETRQRKKTLPMFELN